MPRQDKSPPEPIQPRWQVHDASVQTHRLSHKEEVDIRHGPRPEKSIALQAAELAQHIAHADTSTPADTAPMAVSAVCAGVLGVREDELRRLDGDTAMTEEEERWRLRSQALQAINPYFYGLLELRFLDKWSYRRIAAELHISDKTAKRRVISALLWLARDHDALFGDHAT